MGRREWNAGGVIRTIQVRGEKYEISVDGDGKFSSRAGLDYVSADTLAAVVKMVQRAAAKTRVVVAVPATLMGVKKYTGDRFNRKYHGQTCRRVILTGINPKTDDMNFKYENGEVGKISRYDRDCEFAKPMTDEQITEFEQLSKAKQQADERLNKFEDRFRWREADAVVKKAMGEKLDEPNEPDTDDSEDPR